jgi:hypothetical protein
VPPWGGADQQAQHWKLQGGLQDGAKIGQAEEQNSQRQPAQKVSKDNSFRLYIWCCLPQLHAISFVFYVMPAHSFSAAFITEAKN